MHYSKLLFLLSIATQTSDEEGVAEVNRGLAKRQPRWKRSVRQRKSIAVMETNRETLELTNRFRSSSYSTSVLPPNTRGNYNYLQKSTHG